VVNCYRFHLTLDLGIGDSDRALEELHRTVRLGQLDVVDVLARLIRMVAKAMARIDVPMDAWGFPVGDAADVQQNHRLLLGLLLVGPKLGVNLKSFADEFGRPMTLFAGLARRAQTVDRVGMGCP